jgi:hypothetical protein
MPPITSESCHHERRPGTTVCIQCRRVASGLARSRRRRTAIGLGGVGLSLTLFAAARAAGPNAVDRSGGRKAESGRVATSAAVYSATSPATAAPIGAAPTATPGRPADGPSASLPPLAPIVAEGRTALGEGLWATRVGNTVTVSFDAPMIRTRRPEKFERVVRTTLPRVYGPAADSLLASIPPGALARGGDLLTELPARGIRVRRAAGQGLTVWPETRPGLEGPLVVAYRTTVTR